MLLCIFRVMTISSGYKHTFAQKRNHVISPKPLSAKTNYSTCDIIVWTTYHQSCLLCDLVKIYHGGILIKHDCRFQNMNVKASSSMLSLNSMCNWTTSSSCHCSNIVPYIYSNTNNKLPPCKCTINNLVVYSFTKKLQKTKWMC